MSIPPSYFGTGKPTSNFSTLSIGWFCTANWDSCLKWFMGVKIMFILIETPPGLEIIAGRGTLPISVVLRSEEGHKSELLSLARTSKYVNYTSVLKQMTLIAQKRV